MDIKAMDQSNYKRKLVATTLISLVVFVILLVTIALVVASLIVI